MNDDEVSIINLEFAFIAGVIGVEIDIPVKEAETSFAVGKGVAKQPLMVGAVLIGCPTVVIVEPHCVVGDGDGKRAVGIKGAGNPRGVLTALACSK